MNTTLGNVMTFVGSVAVGCGAAIAIASAAAVTHEAPSLRSKPMQRTQQPAPAEVIRLAPVVVTISNERFEALRNAGTGESKLADAPEVKDKRNG